MALTSDAGKTTESRQGRLVVGRFPVSWVYLLPALVFFLGWQLYPIARVAWLSFTDYYFLSDVQQRQLGRAEKLPRGLFGPAGLARLWPARPPSRRSSSPE